MYSVTYIRCARSLMLTAAVILCLTGAAAAADVVNVNVNNPWIRATVPGQSVASAYMDITSPTPLVLVGVDTPVAGKVELHTMAMDGNVMKMRQVIRITLPANETVSLKPGGTHVMLIDVKRVLKAGERVPLELTLRTRQGVKSTMRVEAEVRAEVRAVQDAATHMHHK